MNLTLHDRADRFPNTVEAIRPMLEQIASWLSEGDYVLQALRIDGVEVFADFEDYITDRIGTVENVDVIAVKTEEAYKQVCTSVASYLERAIPQLELLYKDFYRKAESDAWDRIGDFIEGVQWLYDTSGTLSGFIPDERESFEAYRNGVESLLPELESALAGRDAITIGDIIQYEALPAYRELQAKIDSIMDRLVVRPDVN